MQRMYLWMCVLFVGCESDRVPQLPSCQRVMEHFFASGCGYDAIDTGLEMALGEVIRTCTDAINSTPPRCRDELLAWMNCHSETPAQPKTDADCDCRPANAAMQRCKGQW